MKKNDAYLAEIKNKTHKHVPINYLGDKSWYFYGWLIELNCCAAGKKNYHIIRWLGMHKSSLQHERWHIVRSVPVTGVFSVQNILNHPVVYQSLVYQLVHLSLRLDQHGHKRHQCTNGRSSDTLMHSECWKLVSTCKHWRSFSDNLRYFSSQML